MAAYGCWAFVMECVEDRDCVCLGHQPGGFGFGDPAEVADLPVNGQRATGDLAEEHEGDDGVGHVLVDATEDDGLDGEAGLFPDFAAQAVVDTLAEFKDAAGWFPAAAVKSADEQGAAMVVEDYPGDADRVARRLGIQVDQPRMARQSWTSARVEDPRGWVAIPCSLRLSTRQAIVPFTR